MRRTMQRDVKRYLWAGAFICLVFAPAAWAQAATDTGTVTLSARVTGYVDIAAGGPVTLTGHQGGSVTGNPVKGAPLTNVLIDLGDVSPLNPSGFVVVTVPLRLRSNINYSLSVQSPGFSNADPLAIQASDVGVGIGNIQRTDTGVNAAGSDTPSANVSGDPSVEPDFAPGTARWDYRPEKSLGSYSASQSVLSGDRIMQVVPASHVGGMTLDSYFVVKPQFFTPGTFSTTVTFTISTP